MNETQLILPEGYVTGCLPRKTRFATSCKALADDIETIPRDKWAHLIGKVDLRLNVRQVIDQQNYGSCAACSTTQALMITRDVAGAPFTFLNPLSIYRVTSGGRDNGSSIDENLAFARDTGVLPENYWPYSKGFKAMPPTGWQHVAKGYRIQEFWDIGSVDELGTALLKGFAVVFGWQGHSCVFTRLLSDTEAEYCNSWGKEWNGNGMGRLRLNQVNWGYGSFALRTSTHAGPDPDVPGN